MKTSSPFACRSWRRIFILIFSWPVSFALGDELWVSSSREAGDFPLVSAQGASGIVFDVRDFEVVAVAVEDLAADVERVSRKRPEVNPESGLGETLVYVGTMGRSSIIDRLIDEAEIDVAELDGAWESFLIVTVENPEPGVRQGLAIIGSDRRGTAFGVYELSREIGVSPWFWWADVPPKRSEGLYVRAGSRRFGPPSVKYRGIFINDEDWGLHPWASRTFDPETGDIGPKTYEKVFELLLRLKANTLWPAMHEVTQAFNLYPENKELADRYAIVMASSHAEPMLRNNVTEWTAPKSDYNYATNREGVLKYWEQRVIENGAYENIYSLGMRGIHDSGIAAGDTVEEKADLLSGIIADQRELLKKRVKADLTKIPQAFTPYKEVLELYRAGLDVPEDVTIVWPDDNHGYIRRFPDEIERQRSGGSGVYYHLSYLGSPMAYLWLYTTPPALVWEEMAKAYALGARDYWIANVGDIKPGEIGMDFFLQMAWDIERWNLDTLPNFLTEWAGGVFGEANGKGIGEVLDTYFKLNYQRRPEHLQWGLPHQRVVSSPLTAEEVKERLLVFEAMVAACDTAKRELAAEWHDAYFQLVEYPVKASAFANRRYFHAEQYGRLFNSDPQAARIHGALARRADAELEALTERFNNDIANGKWRRIVAEEPADNMWRSFRLTPPVLPSPTMVAPLSGDQTSLAGLHFAGAREHADAVAAVEREAESFDRSTEAGGIQWRVIPGLGRTGDSIGGFPVTWAGEIDEKSIGEAAFAEYGFESSLSGEHTFYANLVPTFPIRDGEDLRFAIQIDDGPMQIVRLSRDTGDDAWKRGVLAGSITAQATVNLDEAGRHTLRLYLLDPGVVIDAWFLHKGVLAPRFLGPDL